MVRRGGFVARIGLFALVILTLFAAGRLVPSVTLAVPAADDLCVVAPTRIEALPAEAFPGLRPDQARAIPADARCSVCGMYPARSARFAAQLIYDDGATRFFDSPVDLVRFMRERGQLDTARQTQPLAARFVTAFDQGRWLAFEDAVFVHGSDVAGPMRVDGAPAFADLPSARRFIAAHGGTLVPGGAELTRRLSAAPTNAGSPSGHGHRH